MKLKHFFLSSLLVLSMALMHCGSDDEVPPVIPPEPQLVSIQLTASSHYTIVGHPTAIRLSVAGVLDDGNIQTITDHSILINGTDRGRLFSFSSDEAEVYELKAKLGELESEPVNITVRPALELEVKRFQIIFHIVHDGEELGEGYNIEANRIDYQMELLERAFEHPHTVTPNSIQPMIDFELATVDPFGNTLTEPGINRIQRPNEEASILFQNWMWDHYWDPDYYINVWVGDTKNGYSWGIYPTLGCDATDGLEGLDCQGVDYPERLEGIALELDNLFTENWVFPHEMGHVFGLFHVFSGTECVADVDHCADTQQYNRNVYESGGDLLTRMSCSGDVFTSYNVMDYWKQPNGVRDLSYDQVLRIREVIDKGNFRGTKSPADGTPREMERGGG